MTFDELVGTKNVKYCNEISIGEKNLLLESQKMFFDQ